MKAESSNISTLYGFCPEIVVAIYKEIMKYYCKLIKLLVNKVEVKRQFIKLNNKFFKII